MEARGKDFLFLWCLTMSEFPLGTLYSKAVVPSESRKTILLGRPILKSKGRQRDKNVMHFHRHDSSFLLNADCYDKEKRKRWAVMLLRLIGKRAPPSETKAIKNSMTWIFQLCVLPLVCDGESQASSGQREASSGNTVGAGQPWFCHSCQHCNKVCRRRGC